MDNWQFLLLIGIFGYHQQHYHNVNALLSVTNIDLPRIVDFRERVTLSCSYDMANHELNSVKLYKDDMEFFRYFPYMDSPFMTYYVAGVTVPNNTYLCNNVKCSVDLDHLNSKSSGIYTCEISGERPQFKLASRTANMTVAALPQHDPIINGVNPTYKLGDFVVANCSSDWSSPPAILSWYIQDEKVSPELLQPQQETTISTNGFNLRLRSLEIRFHLSQRYLNSKGILRMKCVADINQMPSLRRERITNAFVIYKDNLMNQKLINSSTAHHNCVPPTGISLFIYTTVFVVMLTFLQNYILMNIPK